MSDDARWIKDRALDVVKKAKARAGEGWTLLGPELREGLIAREVVALGLCQAEETIARNPALALVNAVWYRACDAIEDVA